VPCRLCREHQLILWWWEISNLTLIYLLIHWWFRLKRMAFSWLKQNWKGYTLYRFLFFGNLYFIRGCYISSFLLVKFVRLHKSEFFLNQNFLNEQKFELLITLRAQDWRDNIIWLISNGHPQKISTISRVKTCILDIDMCIGNYL
jgi:hypothetical protein